MVFLPTDVASLPLRRSPSFRPISGRCCLLRALLPANSRSVTLLATSVSGDAAVVAFDTVGGDRSPRPARGRDGRQVSRFHLTTLVEELVFRFQRVYFPLLFNLSLAHLFQILLFRGHQV